MAALARRGQEVAPAKVGPDFIDPGYHSLAAGRPSQNLDSWICGPDAIRAMAAASGGPGRILVVEGVMGMFDGAGWPDPPGRGRPRRGPRDLEPASTAEAARLLEAPVLLVVDASAMSSSVAALVHGYASLSPLVGISGVVLNRVGSEGHEALLREALEPLGVPVVGALRRHDAMRWRDRHLGLVPVVEDREHAARALAVLSAEVERRCDLAAIEAIARSAPTRRAALLPPASRCGSARIAVAAGPAFSFAYPDNLRRLEEAGAELVPFDPAADSSLPGGTTGLYAGGGFPEELLEELSANAPMLADVRARALAGTVTWAECGGLLWLCRSLEGSRLCGVLPAAARMTARLELGYRSATARVPNPVIEPGLEARGHEFHYSRLDEPGEALELRGRRGTTRAGFASPTMLASYLHLHLGADPSPAERFVRAAHRRGMSLRA
jgi:cobyrinic acid a,c-diamide synthase